MKKAILILIMIFACLGVDAQEKQAKKNSVLFGLTVPTFTAAPLDGGINFNSNVTTLMIARATIVTPKSYHVIGSNLGKDRILINNGFFIPKTQWDIYFLTQTKRNLDDSFMALGIERKVSSSSLPAFVFVQVGKGVGQNPTTMEINVGLLLTPGFKVFGF